MRLKKNVVRDGEIVEGGCEVQMLGILVKIGASLDVLENATNQARMKDLGFERFGCNFSTRQSRCRSCPVTFNGSRTGRLRDLRPF